MGNSEDLFRALGMFHQGMQQLSIANAAKDAQAQLNDMHANVTDEKERLARSNQIGQELALRLQAAGAPADQIISTAGRLSVSGGENAQMQNALEQQKNTHEFKVLDEMPLAHKNKMAEIALHNQGLINSFNMKFGAEVKKQNIATVKDFQSKNKDLITAVRDANNIDAMLQPINGKVDAAQVAMTLTKLNRALGDNKISDEDVKRIRANNSTGAKIRREIGLNMSGTALKDDVTFYRAFGQVLKGRAQAQLRGAADAHAMGYVGARADGAVDAKEFGKVLQQSVGVFNNQSDKAPDSLTPPTAPQAPSPQTNPIFKYIKD